MNEDPRVDRSESRPWWFSVAPPEPSPLFRLRRALLRLHLHVPHHSGVGRARLDPCRGTTLATPVSTYICGLTGITWCTGATAAGPTWTISSVPNTTPSEETIGGSRPRAPLVLHHSHGAYVRAPSCGAPAVGWSSIAKNLRIPARVGGLSVPRRMASITVGPAMEAFPLKPYDSLVSAPGLKW
jgi:hypothetical protein